MAELEMLQPQEVVTSLLVVCLPEEGLISGFRAGEWTIVERFPQEGEAKLRLQRTLSMLTELKARAFVIKEVDPRDRNKLASWRTLVRFNEPELYLDPLDAVAASPEALQSWTSAVDGGLRSSVPAPKPAAPTRMPMVMVACVAATAVAVIGMIAALQAPRVELKIDPLMEFARKGGITMSIPDKHRDGWYLRVKIHPDRYVEVVDRFPASQLQARSKAYDAKVEDVAAELKDRTIFAPTEPDEQNSLSPKLEAISSAFKRK